MLIFRGTGRFKRKEVRDRIVVHLNTFLLLLCKSYVYTGDETDTMQHQEYY